MPAEPSELSEGLGALRRGGAITELLFVYECATVEPTQLRPIAARLGLTVQAASYTYRQLARRGLIEHLGSRYRPTVRGVAWLHETLDRLGADVRRRIERLHVIRSARAVALDPIRAGEPVSLVMVDGTLSARRGSGGASRGRAVTGSARGDLVEVTDLEGIVPMAPAPITILTLPSGSQPDPRATARARQLARDPGHGLLAAEGLEAQHLLRAAARVPFARFAVAASCQEASQLGVPSTVLVLESDLPRLLAGFAGGTSPPLQVRPLLSEARPGRAGVHVATGARAGTSR